MGKKKAPPPPWLGLLRGTLLALGLYLGGILLLALLMVRGTVPESAAFPMTALLCVLGTSTGGWLASRRTSLGTLPASLLNALLFTMVLAAAGLVCWQGLAWTGRGGGLMLCALGGGILGGLPGGSRGRRRKKRPL